ncbi:hypothetical protein O9929_07660 [Vibrio lentus]|nr:hypothetical protein [Vibrio lentus]
MKDIEKQRNLQELLERYVDQEMPRHYLMDIGKHLSRVYEPNVLGNP